MNSPRSTSNPADKSAVADGTGAVPSAIAAAQTAFLRDLPELLDSHALQWVAYADGRQVAIGATKTELIQQCLREGHQRNSFVVRSIEPVVPAEADCLSEV